MKQAFVLFATFFINASGHGQELPKFLKGRISFCDSSLSDQQTVQLNTELLSLEDYFVAQGLLRDNSGTSYRNVFEQIVRENEFEFIVDTGFPLIDSLSYQVSLGCLYKCISNQELSKLSPRHQRAAEQIASEYHGDVTLRLIAKRILDNLTTEDFNLEFYKLSSLLTFYKLSLPGPGLKLSIGLPQNQRSKANLQTVNVSLTGYDRIEVGNATVSLEQAKQSVYDYLEKDPENRGVELTASRDALYATYIEVHEMLNSVYDSLEIQFGKIPRNILESQPD